MKKVDILGKCPNRHHVFTGELLAEADDPVLNSFVDEAASGLNAPIALVTLVLERIQLFKAHCGLPPDLSASRATERSVSFCQFVVRDGKPFEVVDAENDDRIPKALVERYGVKAYLGIPLHVKDVVVGSLCVLDTKVRDFSQDERDLLTGLSKGVSARLNELYEERRDSSGSLSQRATGPGLAELSATLEPIRACTATARIAATTIESLIRLASFKDEGGSLSPDVLEGALEESRLAMEDLQESLTEIELSTDDVNDCAVALGSLLRRRGGARMSELLTAAQDLSRHICRTVGGAPIPHIAKDVPIATSRGLAILLIASMLNHLATHMDELDIVEGIVIGLKNKESNVVVSVSSPSIPESVYQEIFNVLSDDAIGDPTMQLQVSPKAVELVLKVAKSASE